MKVKLGYSPFYNIDEFEAFYISHYKEKLQNEISFKDYLYELKESQQVLYDKAIDVICNNKIWDNKKKKKSLTLKGIEEIRYMFEWHRFIGITKKYNDKIIEIDSGECEDTGGCKEYFNQIIIPNAEELFIIFIDVQMKIDRYIESEISKIEIHEKLFNTSQIQPQHPTDKIPIKGSIEAVGYIISELINKGYIDIPKRNGSPNKLAIARMIQKHFHYADKDNQPTIEQIRKSLFYDNSLSSDKQKLFKFPTYKQIHK